EAGGRAGCRSRPRGCGSRALGNPRARNRRSAASTGTVPVSGFRVISHSDLAGYGDGMQVLRHRDALYVGHFGPSGMGTSILDVADPARPRVVQQWQAPPGTHMHKVQVADDLLLVNQERFRNAPDRS